MHLDKSDAPKSRTRQRQKLIEACISALHLHGPSRTTIDKVVAIADMSPGIVNFYFDTKAALLMAALEHLADEFEDRVLAPLVAMRHQPVRALNQLIELYLDADIASPRKVSVWYAFWGEASSRAEYYAVCGKRDEAFADLVRDLLDELIRQTGAAHLDADAVALGLIGALEMIWQEIAFHDEAELNRGESRRRCLAYLQSVFPTQFEAPLVRKPAAQAAPRNLPVPALEAAPDQLHEGAKMLVAAELALAGVPVVTVPFAWPGCDIVAQPPHGAVQRLAVRAGFLEAPLAAVQYRRDDNFEWLAIVSLSNEDAAARRIFIVPRNVADMLAGIVSVDRLELPLSAIGRFEGNFALSRQQP